MSGPAGLLPDPGPSLCEAALPGALAEVWQGIEGAVSAAGSATREGMPFALAGVVDLLVGETIPRMRSEAAILLPLIAAIPQAGEVWSRRGLELSRLAESLSILALPSRRSDLDLVRRKTSELAGLLAAQRESETRAVAGLCGLHLDVNAIRRVGEQLERAEALESKSLLRVEEPQRLPTEAFVFRHNPKPPRVVPVRAAERTPSIRRVLGALSTPQR